MLCAVDPYDDCSFGTRGSEESWPYQRERGILALPKGARYLGPSLVRVLMNELSAEVIAWRWSMLSWGGLWDVIGPFIVVLSMGFALGYVIAKYRFDSSARVIPSVPAPAEAPTPRSQIPSAPLRCEFCTDDVNLQIFPYPRCSFCGASPSYHHGRCCLVKKRASKEKRESSNSSWRTIATQSQCTYKRKLLTPRFYPLPESAEGVSDISYPNTD